MNLEEVLVEPDTGEDDGITLRSFSDDNISDAMAELSLAYSLKLLYFVSDSNLRPMD